MKAFCIINPKNNSILLSKYYNKEASVTIDKLLLEISSNKLNLSKGPIIKYENNLIIISEFNYLYYTSVYDQTDSIITEALKIQETIFKAFSINTHPALPNIEFIKENLINILLMIDFYLLEGSPIITDHCVLASLIQNYDFSDKITENYIGKPKAYNCNTLENYLKEIQMNNDNRYYLNSYMKDLGKERILIDLIDDISFITMNLDNSISNYEFSSKLVSKAFLSNKINLGISVNYPYKIDSDDVSFSREVKEKNSFIKDKFLEISPKYGNHIIAKWTSKAFNDASDSNFSMNNTIKLPFKINLNCNSSSTVRK